MATSPIYSWPEPDNTDLVKNGALAIRTLGNAIDTTMGTMVPKTIIDAKGDIIAGTAADTAARLAVGTNGQVLKANSATATGLEWAADSAGMTNPMTTTGDTIYSSSGSTPARLGIGSTGQVLTVAAGLPSWATPSGSSGPAFSASKSGGGTQGISASTWTKITYNTEEFDTDGCFASSRFTPTKSGYYQINLGNQLYSSTASWLAVMAIYKNGAAYATANATVGNNYGISNCSAVVYFNGTTDYVEGYALGTGTSPEIVDSGSTTIFNGVWIRS